MTFWDRLMGRDDDANDSHTANGSQRSEDEIAVERYRYLLRTAPPEAIEQVHVEAFERLTPEQRSLLFDQLTANAAEGDAPADDRPETLARSATRSELRLPGTLERSFGSRQGGGIGMGGMFARSMLGTIAGVVVGSAIAQAFLPDQFGGADSSGDTGGEDAAGADASADGGDFGGGDFGF